LTHSTKLVIDRTVAYTYPPVISAEVRNGNTPKMGAHGRAH
jgi:hypothetical protein